MSRTSCTWCGHAAHQAECRDMILTRRATRSRPAETKPCPCARRGWKDRAACLDPGLEVEFLARSDDEQIAICEGCPVQAECSEYGDAVGLSMVVFAGRRPTRRPQTAGDPDYRVVEWNGL